VLADASHDVIGLNSRLFADCVLGTVPADPRSVTADLRDVTRGFP
jgi:hypothetical protein